MSYDRLFIVDVCVQEIIIRQFSASTLADASFFASFIPPRKSKIGFRLQGWVRISGQATLRNHIIVELSILPAP
jgi:hypothetical protein